MRQKRQTIRVVVWASNEVYDYCYEVFKIDGEEFRQHFVRPRARQ